MLAKGFSFAATLLLLGAAFTCEGSDASVVDHEGRVSLAEAPSFLAELGKMTVGRRSPRAPQLKCDGGSAGCGYVVQPRAVECVNLAKAHQSDNSMAAEGVLKWRCRPLKMMSPHFKMSNVRVSCEGYEDRGDQQHVLQGSCGVEYELDVVVGGNSSGYTGALYYSRSHGFPVWRWSSLAALAVTLVTTVSILYGLCMGSTPSRKENKAQ